MEKSPSSKIKEDRERRRSHCGESPSKISLQQKKEGESHSLKFQYDNKTHGLTCDTSQTVLDALKTNSAFNNIRKTNKDREIVIRKNKGKGAAVNTDFPCMLLKSNEILNITFIKKKENPEEQPNTSYSCPSEDLVSFNVKTEGGKNVRRLMRNNALVTSRVDYVCVYAFKGEKFDQALRRDKRFKEIIFGKNCELADCVSDTIHQMSENVDEHNNKNFEVNVNKYKQLHDSKDTSSKDKTSTNVPSDAENKIKVDPSQHPANTAHENTEQSTSQSGTAVKWQPIQGSEEILKLLRDQFKVLLKQLKEREKLSSEEVRQFYREEYDKSCQSFSEVKKVKEVINLSNSVCQIRSQGSARGTGFLLFNKFILTNAHVIGISSCTQFNPADFTAVFGYEDLDHIGAKYVQIINLTSSFYGKDEKGNHLDYALLEFSLIKSNSVEPKLNSVEKMSEFPELFSHYRNNSPNNKSQICIVGHPNGEVKKMDPCFVIGRENQKEAADKHVSENVQFYHVMTQQSLKEKWQLHKNQISYDSCFFHGSSGSPVFDLDCKLIGIHSGGYVYPQGKKTRSVMEYAFRMQPILDNIKAKARIKGNQEIINILNGNSDEEMEIG